MFAAWFGGFGPGLLAIALAVLAIHYYVVPPLNSFTLKNNLFSLGVAELPRLFLFSIAALFVTFLSSAQRAAAESLRRSRDDLLAATGSAAQLIIWQRGPLFRGSFVLPNSVRYEGHGSKTEFAESSLLVESTRSPLSLLVPGSWQTTLPRSGHINGNSSQNSAKPGKAPIAADAKSGMSAQRSEHDMQTPGDLEISRRDLMIGAAASVAVTAAPSAASAAAPVTETPVTPNVSFSVNGQARELAIDIRTTLLDALRERLQLTGTKKGCDHGQCGACTVIVDGRRINSCLTLAVMHEGASITTIEGLGTPEDLHPMQAAFVKHDGYQCGYCTPGQICSAVAVLDEIKDGVPSLVSTDLSALPQLTDAELRERMSGNICRCGAYSNIVDAITEVARRNA
jgi:xanthine dehydrogenase YagT iron-sulfur-binding subunit